MMRICFRACASPPFSTPGRPSNLRIKPDERGLIDRAAKSVGKTRHRTSCSMRLGARPEDTLLDRAVLSVSPRAYADFLKRLDAPPRAERAFEASHDDTRSLGVNVCSLLRSR